MFQNIDALVIAFDWGQFGKIGQWENIMIGVPDIFQKQKLTNSCKFMGGKHSCPSFLCIETELSYVRLQLSSLSLKQHGFKSLRISHPSRPFNLITFLNFPSISFWFFHVFALLSTCNLSNCCFHHADPKVFRVLIKVMIKLAPGRLPISVTRNSSNSVQTSSDFHFSIVFHSFPPLVLFGCLFSNLSPNWLVDVGCIVSHRFHC